MSTINKKTLLSILTAGLLLVGSSRAMAAFSKNDVGTSGAQFLKLGVNARAIAMGEAYSAVADGADSLYWNPAGLAKVDGTAFSFMHAVYLQSIYYDYAAYAQHLGSLGTIAVGAQYLNARSIDETDEFGTQTGSFNPNDLALSLGWARGFDTWAGKDLTFGVTGKFIRSTVIETAVAGAVDVGASWQAFERLKLALGAQNLGSALKYKDEGAELPANVRLGSAYQITKPWLMSLDANFPRDNDPYVNVGTEYKKVIATDFQIAGRAGYQSQNTSDITGLSSLSLGGGLGWKGYGVDFAWVPFGDLGDTYRISFAAKF